MVITANLTISETDPTYDGADLLITGPVTVAINGAHSLNSLTLTNGATLTHSACTATETHRLELSVTNEVMVAADSRIDVSGQGYVAGRTQGNVTTGASTGGSGGSYGGLGGNRNGTACAVYGDYLDPDEWGSGGGPAYSNPSAGGGLALARIFHT